MKRALIISYFFPPIHCVESTMTLNAIKYLSQDKWRVDVVSAKYSKEWRNSQEYSDRSLPMHLNVYRTNIFENILIRALNRFGLLPDSAYGWFLYAYSRVRQLIKDNNYDVIISRSNPITSHLVAVHFKKVLNIPWITMFGDPWADNPYVKHLPSWIQSWRRKIEKKIIISANKIIVTTESTKDFFIKRYGFAEKFVVLPNTFDPEEVNSIGQGVESSKTFTVTHVGNLYGLRSPEPLFRALKSLKDLDIKVKLVGSLGEYGSYSEKYGISNIIQTVGVVSREKALLEMAKSNLLLLIEAPVKNYNMFLPTKLVEYIAFNKPVLGIVSDGEASDIIKKNNMGLVVSPDDPEAIAWAIKKYYQKFLAGQLVGGIPRSAMVQYSAKTYGERLGEVMDSFISL